MGRRKADSKHIEVRDDRADKRRVQLEERLQEDAQQRRLFAAASVAVGVYLTVRSAQAGLANLQRGGVTLVNAFAGLLGGEDRVVNQEAKEFLQADPLALGLALTMGGMVLAENDPSNLIDSVLPDSLI